MPASFFHFLLGVLMPAIETGLSFRQIRSVREAARQNNIKTVSSSDKAPRPSTTISRWLGWSSRHKWVSRANARDEWITRVSDDQVIANILACKLALLTRAHDFLTSYDSEIFLRGARAFYTATPADSALSIKIGSLAVRIDRRASAWVRWS